VCGTRGTETGIKLYEQFKNIDVGCYYSDYWISYSKMLVTENHLKSKGETYTVEGYNS